MEWYLTVWRQFAEFNGRSCRSEFWMFALFNFLAIVALAALGGVGIAISNDYGGVLFIPFGIYILAAVIPNLAVAARRLHDTGKSGWLLLLFAALGMIPFVGFIAAIVQLIFMCRDSDPGTNQYGLNPKFPQQAGMAAAYSGFPPMGLGASPQLFTTFLAATNYGFCKSCGARLKDAAPFCGNCGGQA